MPDDVVAAFKPDRRSCVVALTHDPKLDDWPCWRRSRARPSTWAPLVAAATMKRGASA